VFTAFLASLAALTIRSEALVALVEATGEWTECDTCNGCGESFASDPTRCVSCPDCQGHGERVVSAWSEDLASTHRAILAHTLVDRSPLTAARANAAALTASLEMTARRLVTRGPFMRWCRCCEEVRDAREFEDDGACVRCHTDLASIAAEQHAAARAAVEADLETWPVEPPALVWNSDADEELSAEVECPACHGHGDVPSGRHSAHDPLGLATCKRCGGDGVIARASLHAEPACAEVA